MKRAIVLIGMVVVFYALPVNGALITIEIEAAVDGVSDEGNYLEGKIKVGDIITGFYTYDSSVTHLPGERYEFDSPPSGVFLSAGGFDFKTDPSSVDFEMGIGNDLAWGDTYFFISFSNLPLTSGVPVDIIRWQLDDPSGSALSSDELPTGAPVLDDWVLSPLLIHGPSRGASFGISAHVISAIPEPCSIFLLGVGVLFLRKRS
jgi:hypothetical protein